MNSSDFLSVRLLSGAFAVAAASNLAQAEMFTGNCGLMPSSLHALTVAIGFLGLFGSMFLLVGPLVQRSACIAILCLSLSHFLTCVIQYKELLSADVLLIEAGFLLAIPGENRAALRFFLFRTLMFRWIGKILTCGPTWSPWEFMKSDALNQPFPFTPVWHLAQLPDSAVAMIYSIIFSTEVILGPLMVFWNSSGPIVCLLGLSCYYTIIGNYAWCPLVISACGVKLLPEFVVQSVIGDTALHRWGFAGGQTAKGHAPENATKVIVGSALSICLICGIAFVLPIVWLHTKSYMVYAFVSTICVFGLLNIVRIGVSRLTNLVLVIAGGISSPHVLGPVFIGNQIAATEDFASLPTCFTFDGGSLGEAVHSRTSRAVFLIQTKFTVVGTNTVGADLGGTRYAELSLPGSVHGDETRPAFLLGHLPRLALKVWKIGTGQPKHMMDGMSVLRRMEKVVEAGSEAMRVFFTTVDQPLIESLIRSGSSNKVQSFYQAYEVTSRAADHQWWKRNYQAVAAIPTDRVGTSDTSTVRKQCYTVLPTRIMGMTLDVILPSVVLGAVVLRLLFTSNSKNKRTIR